MSDLTFSIVTPSFEQRAYLMQACASVAAQVGVEVTHIVVDGASRDGTVEYLESQREATWISEPDEGQSDALNKGFVRATGEFIGWLNADDYYLEGALERVRKHIEANPEVDVVFGDCVFVDAEGRLSRGKAEHRPDSGVLLYHGCYIPSTAIFFRRRILEAGDLHLDKGLRYVMDTDLFLRIMAAGYSWSYLPEYLAAFRWHGANQSLDRKGSAAERLAVQCRFAPRWVPRACYTPLSYVYRFRHVVLKVRSQAYCRDWRLSRTRGQLMHWWEST